MSPDEMKLKGDELRSRHETAERRLMLGASEHGPVLRGAIEELVDQCLAKYKALPVNGPDVGTMLAGVQAREATLRQVLDIFFNEENLKKILDERQAFQLHCESIEVDDDRASSVRSQNIQQKEDTDD